ncbi:MAG: hypothetical protein IPG94_22230, partial [Kineosporiaceae bacterium]|nr:hypothetical protein [Kineosporiaceae bacterium]
RVGCTDHRNCGASCSTRRRASSTSRRIAGAWRSTTTRPRRCRAGCATRRGGFHRRTSKRFDPEFFGISASREASIVDPQQRLLFEAAHEALDDAGHAFGVAGRPVGVYIGGFTMDNLGMLRHSGSARAAINSHTATSGTYTMLLNRGLVRVRTKRPEHDDRHGVLLVVGGAARGRLGP